MNKFLINISITLKTVRSGSWSSCNQGGDVCVGDRIIKERGMKRIFGTTPSISSTLENTILSNWYLMLITVSVDLMSTTLISTIEFHAPDFSLLAAQATYLRMGHISFQKLKAVNPLHSLKKKSSFCETKCFCGLVLFR